MALQTPQLLVDVARLDHNLARTASSMAAAGVHLRPHMKTSKCLHVVNRQAALGALGFTCSTPAEVRLLAEAGHRGLLWAHQPVGEAKVAFAVEAAERWQVTLIADSVEVARPIAELATARGVEIELLMDVDTGQQRTGVPVDSDDALGLALALSELPAINLAGVLTHEGQLGAISDRDDLETSGRAVGHRLSALADRLRAAGLACPIVSVGSTPGLTSAPFADGITEARPGTYVYFDANQLRLGSCTIAECALSVLTTVVSVRTGQAIIDAGLKAMSSDAITPQIGAGIVCDLNLTPLPGVRFSHANEEHGFIVGEVTRWRVGDQLRIVPNHACGTVNMWSQLTAVASDGSTQVWAIEARH